MRSDTLIAENSLTLKSDRLVRRNLLSELMFDQNADLHKTYNNSGKKYVE
jgi:hypothetical protein